MEYSSLTMLTPVQSDLPQLAYYDMAIVGAGISSAYTLIHYIAKLSERAAADPVDRAPQPVKIVVTEKSGEFWTGLPYGSRSGRNALLISPLHEFIPQPLERRDFINWLTINRQRLFNPAEYNKKGELARKWLEANEAAMSQGLWDDLFMPRHTFGLYLQERLENLLETATNQGLIEFKLITADVVDIQQLQDIYQIDLAGENCSSFWAKQLVLAIGSPPNVGFAHAQSPQPEQEVCYIDNMYEPSLDVNIDRICQSLAKFDVQSQRQVLVVGSNAGTLDALYSINNSTAATNLIDKFVVLSPNAAFPHRINTAVVEIDYVPQHLIALVASKSFTAEQILVAVKQDVASASAQGINISDIYKQITDGWVQALKLLSPDEQKQFVIKYAVEIGKYQRRAGGEYLDVVDNLIAQNKLEFLKGKFVGHSPLATGGSSCEYIDSESREQQVFDAPISVIINCAGFQDVTKSSSVLIQNLIRREICRPNDSQRGFVVDQNFKANENCYLMGPLVAGNIDGDFKIWHAESCQRIISLSAQLAGSLIQPELQQRSPLVAIPDVEKVELLVIAA
jgi:uncharacterized NAD(P)/FAD-binding protein YdhS